MSKSQKQPAVEAQNGRSLDGVLKQKAKAARRFKLGCGGKDAKNSPRSRHFSATNSARHRPYIQPVRPRAE